MVLGKPQTDPTLEWFLSHCHIHKYPSKSTLIHQGEKAETLYYIVKGSVAVLIKDEEGKEMILSYLNQGDFNLHAVRVGHRIRLFRQIQQSLRDTTGNVEEGKVAHFFRRDLQTASHLRRQAHQDIRVNLNELTEFFVGDFGHFTCGFRTYPSATLLAFFKQA